MNQRNVLEMLFVLLRLFFPEIDSPISARQVSRQGIWAAIVVTVFTLALALLAVAGELPPELSEIVGYQTFLDAGIAAAIARGIYRMSRFAAVAGLVFHLASRLFLLAYGVPLDIVGIVLNSTITIAFINSIRATFAYHRFNQQ